MKKLLFSALVLLLYVSMTASAQQGVSVGENAPVFKAAADDGSTWKMSKYLGKEYIVVYFYPAAMTGGCTK